MSERDELRRRCDEAVWAELWPESQLDHSSSDGDEIRLCVDAVLAEIERTHVLVEKQFGLRLAVAAQVSDCYEDNGAPCIRGEDWRLIDAMLAESTPLVRPAIDGLDR